MTRISLILLFSIFSVGCFPDTYGGMREFQGHMNDAKEAELHNDHAKAAEHLQAAEASANRISWPDGTLSAKIQLVQVFAAGGRLQEAEREYRSTLSLCLSVTCDRLGSIYENGFFLYAVQMRQIDKADQLVQDLIRNKSMVTDEESIGTRLSRWAGVLREMGYAGEAAALERQIAVSEVQDINR